MRARHFTNHKFKQHTFLFTTKPIETATKGNLKKKKTHTQIYQDRTYFQQTFFHNITAYNFFSCEQSHPSRELCIQRSALCVSAGVEGWRGEYTDAYTHNASPGTRHLSKDSQETGNNRCLQKWVLRSWGQKWEGHVAPHAFLYFWMPSSTNIA